MILGPGDHPQSCHSFVGNSGGDCCLRLSILFRMKFFICCTSCLDRMGGDTSCNITSSPNALRPSWLPSAVDSLLLIIGLLLPPHPLLLLLALVHCPDAWSFTSFRLHLLLDALHSFLYHCLLLPPLLGNSQPFSAVGPLIFLCQASIGFQPLNPTSITLTVGGSKHEVWKSKENTITRVAFRYTMFIARSWDHWRMAGLQRGRSPALLHRLKGCTADVGNARLDTDNFVCNNTSDGQSCR